MAPFVPDAAFKGIGPRECPRGSRYAVGLVLDLCLSSPRKSCFGTDVYLSACKAAILESSETHKNLKGFEKDRP